MSQEEQAKLQKVWAVEIEVLERKLRLWSEHGAQGSPRFHQVVERKQLLESEMENSRKLQELELARHRIGKNIDKLRKECGWSFDKLRDETGIDKKLILSHVHGKSSPTPRLLREYAQAFARELKRPITANNLEE
jgi:ribosome-binding protein aMBF1 (putative translation factor)